METKRHAADPIFRPPSAGASKIVTDREIANLPEELLTVLLHDLRSPLGAIGVLADLITATSQTGDPPDSRQLSLLQEAVTKAQRVLDDAVEIQAVIRGSSTFTPALVEVSSIIRASLDKAIHAPYFRNVHVDYTPNGTGEQLIRVDVEKAETALLCAFEHVVTANERPTRVTISHPADSPLVSVRISNGHANPPTEPPTTAYRLHNSLRGRLGTRRLGESRYNIHIVKRVMTLMGGELLLDANDHERSLILRFPGATYST